MIENRVYDRRKMEAEVSLYSDDNFYAGITGDISEGGVFVVTYTPPPLGTVVDLDVLLPTGHRLVGQGEVRWVRDISAARDGIAPGCGVRFVGLGEADIVAIRDFVTARETIYMDDEAA